MCVHSSCRARAQADSSSCNRQPTVQLPDSPERFAAQIPDARDLNHISVFLTGQAPFPEGYGCTIHLEAPCVPLHVQVLARGRKLTPTSSSSLVQRKGLAAHRRVRLRLSFEARPLLAPLLTLFGPPAGSLTPSRPPSTACAARSSPRPLHPPRPSARPPTRAPRRSASHASPSPPSRRSSPRSGRRPRAQRQTLRSRRRSCPPSRPGPTRCSSLRSSARTCSTPSAALHSRCRTGRARGSRSSSSRSGTGALAPSQRDPALRSR